MTISPSARATVQAEYTDVVPIELITISHPDLAEPVRLASYYTERLPGEPLRYATRHQGEIYYYALIGVSQPGRGEGADGMVTITIDIVTPGMAAIPGSIVTPATVDIVVVMSDAPDIVEVAFRGMEAKSAPVDTQTDTIRLEVGAMPRLDEPTQRHRMTADRFPGLHRR